VVVGSGAGASFSGHGGSDASVGGDGDDAATQTGQSDGPVRSVGKAHVRLNNAALLRVRGVTKKEKKAAPVQPIYDWERRALKKEGVEVVEDDSDDDVPLTMEEPVLEFQVRLTEAEYKHLLLCRRRKVAEAKFMARASKIMEASKLRAEEKKLERGASGIAVTGPYVEPVVLESYMFRSPQPKKWVNDKPFNYIAKPPKVSAVGR
jgi:hypothetical protein